HGTLGCTGMGFTWNYITLFEFGCSGETSPFGFVSAAGTLMILVFALMALAVFKIYRIWVSKFRWNTTYYFIWMLTTVSLFRAFGQMLFSPLLNFGDFFGAFRHVKHSLGWRLFVT